MNENKKRVKNKIYIGILSIVVLVTTFFMVVGVVQTVKEANGDKSTQNPSSYIADANTESNSSNENITTTQKENETTEETTQETTQGSLFKELIYLEAGSTQVNKEDLFVDYKGQSCVIKTVLTEEEVRKFGAVYDLQVMCAGNYYTVKVEIIDTTQPTIEGIKDIYVCIGDTIAYRKNLSLSDNSDGDVTVSIDNKLVDVSTVGEYPVEYKAVDIAGNSATASITVHVTEKPVINEDYMQPFIQAIVDSVVNENMTTMEKAYALYQWCRKNISYYYGSTDRSSVWQGAYDGIIGRLGDCYVYCCTYEVLLTYAGIENMVVARTHDSSNHWWNLVKIDEGWYHCDSSPRTLGDSYRCFMQTDAQLAAYAANNPRPYYYDFDKTLYPERGTVEVYR